MLIEDRLDQLETLLPHYTRRRTYETTTVTVTRTLSNRRAMATLVPKNCVPQGFSFCTERKKNRESKVAKFTKDTTEMFYFGWIYLILSSKCDIFYNSLDMVPIGGKYEGNGIHRILFDIKVLRHIIPRCLVTSGNLLIHIRCSHVKFITIREIAENKQNPLRYYN